MNQIKVVVFDWDGVIVDSMPIFALGIQKVAASYGVHKTVEDIVSNYFQPRQAYYASIGIIPSDIEELHRRHGEAVAEHVGKAPIFPDVIPALNELKLKDYVLGIATQNEAKDAVKEIKRVNVKDYFSDSLVIGGQGPKTDKLRQILRITKCNPRNVIYVGDLPTDITSAKEVGVQSAGIARNQAQKKRLVDENPDFVLSSMDDLIHVL